MHTPEREKKDLACAEANLAKKKPSAAHARKKKEGSGVCGGPTKPRYAHARKKKEGFGVCGGEPC